MSHSSLNAAIIAHQAADADFTESTLTSHGYDVRRYETPEQFAREFQQHLLNPDSPGFQHPNVAILAGPLDDLATGRVVATVRTISRALPLLAAGSNSTTLAAVDLMKQGACDVVDLPCDRDLLWQRIRDTVDRSDERAASDTRSEELRARFDQLTKAENDVLDAMLDGFANKQIAQRLSIGLRTVELRRSKIMRKMQAKSVAELVKYICLAGGIHE
ncbi:MAG: response regulator transcription factor [Aeoliella sp.]